MDAHLEEAKRQREEQIAARAIAASQRSLAVMMIGIAVGGLLSFLILPLLILIEENTRRLRATALLAADRPVNASA